MEELEQPMLLGLFGLSEEPLASTHRRISGQIVPIEELNQFHHIAAVSP